MHISADISTIGDLSRDLVRNRKWSDFVFDLFRFRFSFSKWIGQKSFKLVKELHLSTSGIKIDDLSPKDQKYLFELTVKTIDFLISFSESLENSKYFGIEGFRSEMRKTLDTMYVLEGGLKKRVKAGNRNNSDSDLELKQVLRHKSIQSLESKL